MKISRGGRNVFTRRTGRSHEAGSPKQSHSGRFRVDSGWIPGRFQVDSGSIPGQFGLDSGLVRDRLWIVTESIWDRFGSIQSRFRSIRIDTRLSLGRFGVDVALDFRISTF